MEQETDCSLSSLAHSAVGFKEVCLLMVPCSFFSHQQVPLEEGLNKAIHYFRKELEYQANNQYIPKPKPARVKKGRTRHS